MEPPLNPLLAAAVGIRDLLIRRPPLGVLDPALRFDGTALVTGASSGLGFAAASSLIQRGAHVVAVGRDVAALERLRAVPGDGRVTLRPTDLADLDQVVALADGLSGPLDRLFACAGCVMTRAQASPQGLEQMQATNWFANHVLLRRLLAAGQLGRDGRRPRVILVGSEAHRGAAPPDPARLGAVEPFSAREALSRYGTSKLGLVTLGCRLARTLEQVDVHQLCPGAVDSGIARDAPPWAQRLLRPVTRCCFQSPEAAATPVLYLALAPELEGRSGLYLHQGALREPDPRALDPDAQERLWQATEALLGEWLPSERGG